MDIYISLVLCCQLCNAKLVVVVDPKELLLPEWHVEEAFLELKCPTIEPNILLGDIVETVAILLNHRDIMA